MVTDKAALAATREALDAPTLSPAYLEKLECYVLAGNATPATVADVLRSIRESGTGQIPEDVRATLRELVTDAEALRRHREQAVPWCPACGESIGENFQVRIGMPLSIIACPHCWVALGVQLTALPQPQSRWTVFQRLLRRGSN